MGEQTRGFQEQYSEQLASREGNRDGRGWSWSAMPPFLVFDRSALEIIDAGDVPPFLKKAARSAQLEMTEIVRSWCQKDGSYQVSAGQEYAAHLSQRAAPTHGSDRALQTNKKFQRLAQSRETDWKTARSSAAAVIAHYGVVCQGYRQAFFRARGRGGKKCPDWIDESLALPIELDELPPLLDAVRDGMVELEGPSQDREPNP